MKRRRLTGDSNGMSDITVEIDHGNEAPPLVSQLETAVFDTVNPISSCMMRLLEDLGFSDEEISPFCQQQFAASGDGCVISVV